MKTTHKIYYILFALILASTASMAQRQDLQHFELEVNLQNDNGLTIRKHIGVTDWDKVSYADSDNDTHTLNHRGLDSDPYTSYPVTDSAKDAAYTPFKFTIKRTGNLVMLVGIRGTAWKDLSFVLPDKNAHAFINEYGMVNKTTLDNPNQEK
jgi:hypothetical protein